MTMSAPFPHGLTVIASPIKSGQARSYQRTARILTVSSFLVDLTLVLVLLAGLSTTLRSLAVHVTSSPIAAVLIYLACLGPLFAGVGLPLDYLRGFWLEHCYGLSNQTRWAWIKDKLKGWAVAGVLAVLGTEFLYWTLREWPHQWWVICALLFSAVFVLLANLAPIIILPIFFKFQPVKDATMVARLLDLSRRAGARVNGVFEWNLSEKSRKANAALVGLGNTRRIILADTLLEKFSEDEVEAVLAHELGHHAHRHLLRGLLIQTITTFVGFYLAELSLNHFSPRFGLSHKSDFANLPLLILIFSGLSFLLLPLLNWHARGMERQADLFALRVIPHPSALATGLEKLADLNLTELQPPPWIEFIFHSHPSLAKRIRLAKSGTG